MAGIPLLPPGSSGKESLRGRGGPTEQAVPTLHSETPIQGGGTI